jgi:cholesterol transport system auxiliary component
MSRARFDIEQLHRIGLRRPVVSASASVAAVILTGCGSLFAPAPPSPHFYTLDSSTAIAVTAAVTPASSPGALAPVILVATPRAAAGFDTDRIVYVLEAHRLQPYADSQWIDTPSKMLEPMISAALSRTETFDAVLEAPSAVNAQWELQSDIVRLEQEVVAARFRFTLRVTLIEKQTRTVVLARDFDSSAPLTGTGPAAAVAAANVVVAEVLRQMAEACASEVARRR